jgi:hypothetical protein
MFITDNFSVTEMKNTNKGSNFELFTKVWAHKTSLAPPLFIEAPVPSQESERSCICIRVINFEKFKITTFIGVLHFSH